MFNFMSYIVVLILTFIFTYIFGVKETYVLFYLILLIPVFDFLYFTYSKNKLSLTIENYDKKIEKGEECNICIGFKNKGILPIEYFTYVINLGDKFTSKNYLIENRSLGSRKSDFRNITVVPVHIGLSRIKINNIKITSLFGLFQKNYNYEINVKINVLPKLHVIENSNKLIEYDISDSSCDYGFNNNKTGDPGYEYRSYIKGDPLTKVNWKLSLKKNELIIRKDEVFKKIKKIVILDSFLNENEDYYNISDYLIEGAFSIVNSIFLNDIETDFYLNKNNKWICYEVKSKKDINIIKEELSNYEFSENKKRFSNLNINNKDKVSIVILTINKDIELSSFYDFNINNENNVIVISDDNKKMFHDELLLTADFKLESK